jgi:succinoglycan biosynthesis transport protein ExoP
VNGLGFRLVGTLPVLPRRPRRKRLGPGGGRVPWWHASLLESVDNLRTSLLHSADTRPFRSVIVSSAVAGEGKTSLACNLATSVARSGRRTLLIDGDLRKPDVHKVFDLPAGPGLCEVLRGESDVDEVTWPTAIANLWVVTAGACDDQALRALAQDIPRALFERLYGRFDFIVIDSAPLLPIADAGLLARQVDAAVQAVLNGVSTLPLAYAAHDRLLSLGVRTLGVVVAGVRGPRYGDYGVYHSGRPGSANREVE